MLLGLYAGGGEKISIDICNEWSNSREHKVILCSIEQLNERHQIMFSKIVPTGKFVSL